MRTLPKLLTLFLIVVMVLSSATASFAADNVKKSITIKLDIAKSERDLSIIKQYQKKKDAPYSKKNNHIKVVLKDIKEEGNTVIVSGTAKVKMFGDLYESTFEDKALEIKYVKNKKFYTGGIESRIDDRYTALIDITTMYNSSKSIIQYTLVDELTGEQQVMFYGDTFKEQVELMKQEIARIQA